MGTEPPIPRITLWSEALDKAGEGGFPDWRSPIIDPERPFHLTCGKTTAYCHSQFRQIIGLRRRQPEPVAELAPDVAAARSIQTGDSVTVLTAQGEIHYRAEINPKLAAGTIWAHYGWWQADRPINYNAAMDGERFDAVSGSNHLRGIACDVRKIPDIGSNTATMFKT